MNVWTLASDESGKFEPNEPYASLVGGVLLPGPAEAHEDLRDALAGCCRSAGVEYPPHSTVLRQQEKLGVVEELLATSAGWLETHGGFFIAVVCKPEFERTDAAHHARTLGAFVDLAARVAAAHQASALDLRPASRRFPVESEQASTARSAGLHVQLQEEQLWLHGVLGTEVRESLDALARSPEGRLAPWPKLNSIEVSTAKWGGVHPGVVAADLFCNRVYGAARDHVTEARKLSPAWNPRTILIVDQYQLDSVREVDQTLRHDPPSLHQLGVALARIDLAQRSIGRPGPSIPLGVRGARSVAELFFSLAEQRLVDACSFDPKLAWALAQTLAGDAQSELEMKHGDYEGTGIALRLGFSGDNPLAKVVRSGSDRELLARLHRLELECSNHRGDLEGAGRARAGFSAILAQGPSLVLLGEALKVENLANVALQNRLPCAAEEAPELMLSLTTSAGKLREVAQQLSQPVFAFAASSPPAATALNDDERALRDLAQSARAWTRSDREYGRCLGTAARSLAFAGELGAAREVALEARTYFEDSPFDLTFNAAVLARIEIERARLDATTTNAPLLTLLLRMAGAEELRDGQVAEAAVRTDPSRRFAFDLLLRQLLWAPSLSSAAADSALVNQLGLGVQGGLYRAISAEHSHPTELIARHAAELLRRRKHKPKVIQPWFELSLELTASSPMPTLQRLAAFTSHLKEGREPEGPNGSVLNPSFEYR